MTSYTFSGNQPRNSQETTAVTVIGLGPMGRALAGALLGAGYSVSLWNRTPEKASALVDQGAYLAATPEEALGRSELAIFCVLDDNAVEEIVDHAASSEGFKNLTLVNLTADSPARTRNLSDRLAVHGITLLDGAIMSPAAAIGTETTSILYAGPQGTFQAHRHVLASFGGTAHYLGEDIALAATYDVALLTLFWTSITGLAQALALTHAEGLDVENFVPHAVSMSQLVTDLLPNLTADFAAGRYSGSESATIDSVATSLEHLHAALARSEVSTEVIGAIQELVKDAALSGYGGDAPIRLADSLQRYHPSDVLS